MKNIHRVVRDGKVYLYHRPTRTPLTEPPGSPEFIKRVNALNARKKPPAPRSATLGGVLAAYRASPEYERLRPNTVRNYDRSMRFLDKVGDMPLAAVNGPFVIGLRDKVFKRSGWTQANHVLMMIRTLWAWGQPRGLTEGAPADGIKDIPRPKGLKQKNRRWRPEEVVAFLEHCKRPDVCLAVVIAANTGLRSCDVLALKWSFFDGEVIDTTQIKTGADAYIPVTPMLKAALDAAPRVSDYIVATGPQPIKEESFTKLFCAISRGMQEAGIVGPGLTFHGLRHTVAAELADLGATNRVIMAITGHRSESQVATYTRDADRKKAAREASRLLATVKRTVNSEDNPDKSDT